MWKALEAAEGARYTLQEPRGSGLVGIGRAQVVPALFEPTSLYTHIIARFQMLDHSWLFV